MMSGAGLCAKVAVGVAEKSTAAPHDGQCAASSGRVREQVGHAITVVVSEVEQSRSQILAFSHQHYYTRWPVLLRPIRTADGFSDRIRIVGHTYKARAI